MVISEQELAAIAQLAYLDSHCESSLSLAKEINTIIDFVQQLRQVDTTAVTPLFHPFDGQQRLREDIVCEQDCAEQLAAIAPLFNQEEGFYLVPKVIDSGK